MMPSTPDKKPFPSDFSQMTGLEQMQLAFMSGKRPPIAETMSIDLDSIEHGKVVFSGEPAEKHLNPIGSIHGGYAATILDSALGCSIHTTLEPGEKYTTVDLNVKYVRGMKPGMGRVTCTAEVIHKGRKIATADAKLVGEDGKIYAHGNTTCIIL
ncbi:PaaI family thioesterase [Sneathiella aquimaris]|uniref:PaaI family thioesterase n=1 Tax=Sneathiella aquimaris TaxID=2599305 RepID=UPI00146F8665|nr:PaaI family thioesterase [Sneathiella aquimaris]